MKTEQGAREGDEESQRGEDERKPGMKAAAITVKATACRVWPEGKLNSSSGAVRAITPGRRRRGADGGCGA